MKGKENIGEKGLHRQESFKVAIWAKLEANRTTHI